MSKKIKIVSVVGNRPQFIKIKPLVEKLDKYKAKIKHKIIHTGQHYNQNMSKVFFDELKLPTPDYNLNVGGLSHISFISLVIKKLEDVLKIEKPSCILVYGDTNSTFAASICASKMNIDLFHVEAGLRSFNLMMPEEKNRIVTDHLSDLNFVPTINAKNNLIAENIHKNKIKFVGDLMREQLFNIKKNSYFKKTNKKYKNLNDYGIMTIHREENTKDYIKINHILKNIKKIDLCFLWPYHPRLKKFLKRNKIIIPNNIQLIQPLSYINMIACIKNSKVVLTDSGGVQRESYFLKKPCVVLRDRTEWKEICNKNNAFLMRNINDLEKLTKKSLKIKIKYNNDFGNLNVSNNIIKEIINFYE